jgi:hypothetical protein
MGHMIYMGRWEEKATVLMAAEKGLPQRPDKKYVRVMNNE